MTPLRIARILRSTVTGAGSVAGTPGVDQGLVYEVVGEMAKRVRHTGLIELLPWGEVQRIPRTQPNIGILALPRTPERENQVHWLARIVTDDLNFGEIVRKSEICLAASKDLPDAEARKWERAIEATRSNTSAPSLPGGLSAVAASGAHSRGGGFGCGTASGPARTSA